MNRVTTERVAGMPVMPLGDRAAVGIIGASRSDVAREALKIARAESQSRPVLLVDLLGHGSALDQLFSDDDPHGVSDAARYGVSLARVARPVPDADTLFVVPGGLESPLADDVLSDHMWGSWSDQCRRAGALLVVAAPADLPSVHMTLDQLDGVVMIGDAVPPHMQVPLIGRVPGPRHRPVDVPEPRRISPEELAVVRKATPSHRWWVIALVAAGAAVVAAGIWWALAAGWIGPGLSPVGAATTAGEPPGAVAGMRGPVAEWAVELASVSSMPGVITRMRQAQDAAPAPTFAPIHPGSSSTVWYRLVAGGFPSRGSADSLLSALRARGLVDAAGGRVVRAPLGWLVEDGVGPELLPTRLTALREQGLPAYALRDDRGGARVYVGAFETEDEGRLLLPVLDSLNLHATLAPRVGSIR